MKILIWIAYMMSCLLLGIGIGNYASGKSYIFWLLLAAISELISIMFAIIYYAEGKKI